MSFLEHVQAGITAMNIDTAGAENFFKDIIKNSIGAVFDSRTSKVTKVFLVIILTLCLPLLLACVIGVALAMLAIILIACFVVIPMVLLFLYTISSISVIKVNCFS